MRANPPRKQPHPLTKPDQRVPNESRQWSATGGKYAAISRHKAELSDATSPLQYTPRRHRCPSWVRRRCPVWGHSPRGSSRYLFALGTAAGAPPVAVRHFVLSRHPCPRHPRALRAPHDPRSSFTRAFPAYPRANPKPAAVILFRAAMKVRGGLKLDRPAQSRKALDGCRGEATPRQDSTASLCGEVRRTPTPSQCAMRLAGF